MPYNATKKDRKDGELRFRIVLLVLLTLLLTACGATSQKKVSEKIDAKWNDGEGYELTATMQMNTGGQERIYDVTVWHTKPDFYRVTVTEQSEKVTQMIVRNEEGVFVVTPALRKSYKFQSDWPNENSQAYLISALAHDVKSDEKAVMTEQDQTYTFETTTRNAEKTGLPVQKIVIDKETMLPKKVSLLNEAAEEKISIEFKSIDLGQAHKKEEYAVEKFPENEENEVGESDNDSKAFQTYYPSVLFDGVKLADERAMEEGGEERVILTFEGEKDFTILQRPVDASGEILPVFAPGDLADLGFTIGAITDTSISWEKDGMSFFLASTELSRKEMMEVAASMTEGSLK